MSESWFIAGAPGAGVTRLFEEHVRGLGRTQIGRLNHFAVFVIDPHFVNQFSAPDLLFNLRNTVVTQANLERRQYTGLLKNRRSLEADKHFTVFDTLWLAWFTWEFGPGVPPPHFALSSAKRLRKWLTKRAAGVTIDLLLAPISVFTSSEIEAPRAKISIVGMEGISSAGQDVVGGWAGNRISEGAEWLIKVLRQQFGGNKDYEEILERFNTTPAHSQNQAFWLEVLADAFVPAARKVLQNFKEGSKALVLLDSADTLSAPACKELTLALTHLRKSLQDANIALVIGGRLPDHLSHCIGHQCPRKMGRIIILPDNPAYNVCVRQCMNLQYLLDRRPYEPLSQHFVDGRLAILSR